MMKEERKFFQIFYSLYIYILICAIATTSYFYSNGEIMYDENVFTISKALIISLNKSYCHIVYEELYTKNNTVISTRMLD